MRIFTRCARGRNTASSWLPIHRSGMGSGSRSSWLGLCRSPLRSILSCTRPFTDYRLRRRSAGETPSPGPTPIAIVPPAHCPGIVEENRIRVSALCLSVLSVLAVARRATYPVSSIEPAVHRASGRCRDMLIGTRMVRTLPTLIPYASILSGTRAVHATVVGAHQAISACPE